jgi:hypothetical protein
MGFQLSTLLNDQELKIKVAATLDVVEFLDTVQMSFAELLDIVFDELNEEQKEELTRTVEY